MLFMQYIFIPDIHKNSFEKNDIHKLHTLPGQQKSSNLDLAKQVGNSLLLDKYCMGHYVRYSKITTDSNCERLEHET